LYCIPVSLVVWYLTRYCWACKTANPLKTRIIA